MSSTRHWRNSPACSEESRTRPWNVRSWPDCLPIPRSCCVHLPILTAFRRKAYLAEQGPLWTMKGFLPSSTDQPQKKCLYPSPRRTRCIVLTALSPIIWLSAVSLNDRGSAVSQPSDVTEARKGPTSRQNVRKRETGTKCERHSRPRKNENQPASDACMHQRSDAWRIDWLRVHTVSCEEFGSWPTEWAQNRSADRWQKNAWPAEEWLVSIYGWIRGPRIGWYVGHGWRSIGVRSPAWTWRHPPVGGVHLNEHGEAIFPNEVFDVGAADAVKIERLTLMSYLTRLRKSGLRPGSGRVSGRQNSWSIRHLNTLCRNTFERTIIANCKLGFTTDGRYHTQRKSSVPRED